MAAKRPTTKKTTVRKAPAKKAGGKKSTVKKAAVNKVSDESTRATPDLTAAQRPTVAKPAVKPQVESAAPVPDGNAAASASKSIITKSAPVKKERSAAEKKALADKILAMTGGLPLPDKTSKPDSQTKAVADDKAAAKQDTVQPSPQPTKASTGAASQQSPRAEFTQTHADSSPLQPPAADPMDGMSTCMDKFRETFEASARRWELVVYPSLLAFIILAIYGFYLIQSLTTNVGRMADRFDGVAEHMQSVAEDMGTMTGQMGVVTTEMGHISLKMTSEDESLKIMVHQMSAINESAHIMSVNMQQMRQDISVMGYNLHNAAGPMRFMNSFVPW